MSSPDYRAIQKALTELNADGNDERGHYGEDESSLAPLHFDSRKISDEQWIEILKVLNGKEK
jgi:hypothetical protein